MAQERITLERDYIDSFSMKDFAVNQVMPTFFPGLTPSNLTTGTIGMLSEYISTITEDAFNTGSSLLSEVFPTRSKMQSSIYSNAAIFQLTEMFGDGGRCTFMLLISEEDVRKNLQQKRGSEYGYFYIDKDMIIRVGGTNGTPFMLDYDIEIRALYRESLGKWVYSAKYIVEEYKNSISDITDPYIRLQQYPNGMLVMSLTLRQYVRLVQYEPVIDNAQLNYPTIKVTHPGDLIGFDVLYKEPGDTEYHIQLDTKVVYSIPEKKPFCYYRMIDSTTFEISFTTKDSYFQPKFNSELMIVTYVTKGKSGDFEFYDGEEFSIVKGEKYSYDNSWLVAAKSVTGCNGGKDPITVDGLKDLTVEGFTTAMSLNTENDLQVYFNNYKHRHDNEVLFIKKRNDAVELLFSAFMYIKKSDYIYPTNTLYLDTNIQYLEYKDGGFYNLDPGYLFGYKGTDAYFIPYYFVIVGGDGDKYDPEGHYYDVDGNRDPTKDITLRELNKKIRAGYVEETDHSYWRLVGNDGSFYFLYHADGSLYEDVPPISQEELFTKFNNGELTYGTVDLGAREVDFIMDFEAEAAARKEYIAYFDQFKIDKERPDMIFDEYLFEYTFKDFKSDRGIDNRRSMFNTDVESFSKGRDFLFVNPFITTIAKDTGLVSYYQSFINKNVVMDYIAENSGQTFDQFITYTFRISRDVTMDKRYTIRLAVTPSSPLEEWTEFVQVIYDVGNLDLFLENNKGEKHPSSETFDKTQLIANDLRMIVTFTYKDLEVGYLELVPTEVDMLHEQIWFEGVIHTDDFISAANTLRITHICPHCGHEVLNSSNTQYNFHYKCDVCDGLFQEGIINTREMDTLELPINTEIVKVTALFRDRTRVLVTDNEFVQFDKSYTDYRWTNVYSTINNRVIFMEPLDMMRSSIIYKDYFVTGVDALDCEISDLPLLKYSIMAYNKQGPKIDDPLLVDDIGKFDYFMQAFLDNYDVLLEAKEYLNGMHIDTKFYNSYGRSTNFDIGEDGEPIDTNNIAIYYDIYVVAGTDTVAADAELKIFIKDHIETINEEGSNDFHNSNMIREIENNFSYVHHIKFKGINRYDSRYQSIINKKISLDDLSKTERRKFVPDILVINRNNIFLSFYQDER